MTADEWLAGVRARSLPAPRAMRTAALRAEMRTARRAVFSMAWWTLHRFAIAWDAEDRMWLVTRALYARWRRRQTEVQ